MAENDASKGQDVQDAEGEQQAEVSPELKALKDEIATIKSDRLKLQQALTRQGYELGQARQFAERVTLAQLEKPKEKPDFFADPEGAVSQAITSHPVTQTMSQAMQEMHRQNMTAQLRTHHPDYQQITKDEAFVKWVDSKPKLQKLYGEANEGYDFEAADYLLTEWKERQTIAKTAKTEQELRGKNDDALKAAKVDTGNAGVSGKKIYAREDLRRLRITDPDKYNSLNPAQLYAEGRVK